LGGRKTLDNVTEESRENGPNTGKKGRRNFPTAQTGGGKRENLGALVKESGKKVGKKSTPRVGKGW